MLVLLHGGGADDDDHDVNFLKTFTIVKIHAAFQILAWGFLLASGSVLARYLKRTPNSSGFFPRKSFSIRYQKIN